MPKGYVIGRADVTNPTAWAEYAAKASEAIKKYGGNPIVRGGKMETVEGQGVPRNASSSSRASRRPGPTRILRNTRPQRSCARVPAP